MWRKIILTAVVALFAMLGLALPAAAEPVAVPQHRPGSWRAECHSVGQGTPQRISR